MADGSLVEAAFRHYLIQDYLFLIEFARAYALAVYKAQKLADMREAANLQVVFALGRAIRSPPKVLRVAHQRALV